MKKLKSISEVTIIRFGLIFFWTCFWLLNVIDKFFSGETNFWVGKDRMAQFVNYYSSLGIESSLLPQITLGFVTIVESLAFIFLLIALISYVTKRRRKAQKLFFWGTLMGLIIFSFFSLGDQVFGDRMELWEHTSYWVALLISWAMYRYLPKK